MEKLEHDPSRRHCADLEAHPVTMLRGNSVRRRKPGRWGYGSRRIMAGHPPQPIAPSRCVRSRHSHSYKPCVAQLSHFFCPAFLLSPPHHPPIIYRGIHRRIAYLHLHLYLHPPPSIHRNATPEPDVAVLSAKAPAQLDASADRQTTDK
jgi:hypothetical protein